MTLFKLRVTTLTTRLSFSWLKLPFSTKAGSATEAKLQTATSSGDVYWTISVQRLLDLMVPRFCWLLLALHASLYNMYGVPVSICDSRILNQSCCALKVFRPRPSFSYRVKSS